MTEPGHVAADGPEDASLVERTVPVPCIPSVAAHLLATRQTPLRPEVPEGTLSNLASFAADLGKAMNDDLEVAWTAAEDEHHIQIKITTPSIFPSDEKKHVARRYDFKKDLEMTERGYFAAMQMSRDLLLSAQYVYSRLRNGYVGAKL